MTVLRRPGEPAEDFAARVEAIGEAGPAALDGQHLTCWACVVLGAVPAGPPYWLLRWHLCRMGSA
jgi:hypothetical protein